MQIKEIYFTDRNIIFFRKQDCCLLLLKAKLLFPSLKTYKQTLLTLSVDFHFTGQHCKVYFLYFQ